MLRFLIVVLALAGPTAAQVHVTGRVVDEDEAPVANARITVHCGGAPALETYSGPSGSFQFPLAAPGDCRFNVDRAGYFQLQNFTLAVSSGSSDVAVTLHPQREVFQSVTVGAAPAPVDPAQTQREERLSGTEVNDIPYPASHSLRNAMKLMPGVVQDPTGGIHIQGGAEYQTRYTLDGFDITNPIDGRYSTRLAIDGVQSLDLSNAREAANFGNASAGTLQIKTESGTDQFHTTATNFVPGLNTQGGLHLGDWTPRAGLSGPIVRGRAWFSDSFDGEYNSGDVAGLPSGQNTNALWSAGNLLHAQVNLTPTNILFADLLTDFDHQAHYGLGVLDPLSTTRALSDRQVLGAIKASHSWSGGAVLEIGFAWQTFVRGSVPQGDALYVVAPDGRSGNYFERAHESGRRTQLFANYFPRLLKLAGRHQLQVGADAQRLDYSAAFQRSGYELLGLSGLPLFETTFRGSGDFERPGASFASYVNDHWQLCERVTIDAGLREDWDELARQTAISPRLSVAYAPFANGRTRINAGYAVVHDATNLSLFSRPLDQQAVTVPYSAAGTPEAALVTTFVAGSGLKLPRFDKWSAGLAHDFGHRISARAEWLRKRGRDGFVYAPEAVSGPVSIQPISLGYGYGGTYALANQRRDLYDEVALVARQTFGDQYGWMASYVRSRAASDAVLDVSVDQPLQVLDNFGRMPWDAPNRVLGWGYFPLPFKQWAVAFLADYRTGFPFPVTTDAGVVAGPVDAHRYPSTFDLNLAVERRFTFAGYRFALRAGANNLTGHHNFTAVNAVIGAPQYLQFFGDEGRHFVFRIRVFGRAPR